MSWLGGWRQRPASMTLGLKKPSASFWVTSGAKALAKKLSGVDRSEPGCGGRDCRVKRRQRSGQIDGRQPDGGGHQAHGLGLGIAEIQSIARELLRFGRDKLGANQMGEIIAGTPGLSH